MDDATLFAFGCAVTFLFLAGGYVLFRVSFSAPPPRPPQVP